MYRTRKANRLKGYDYTNPNFYSVTLCVDNNIRIFGKIENGSMLLNQFGLIVENYLHKIPLWFKQVKLDYFIIMPDHIHIIFKFEAQNPGRCKSLSTVMGTFKSQSSFRLKSMGLKNFQWKRSFYDRIIRDEEELIYTREYISLNPLRAESKGKYK